MGTGHPYAVTANADAVTANAKAVTAIAGAVTANADDVTANADAISDLQSAIASKEPQLVGFTTESFLGDRGVLDFTKACQADFPGSRMCTSTEIMKTTAVPVLAGLVAWVRPHIITNTGTGSAIDASGVQEEASDLSCKGWTTRLSPFTGLSVSLTGSFGVLTCEAPLRVACCRVDP